MKIIDVAQKLYPNVNKAEIEKLVMQYENDFPDHSSNTIITEQQNIYEHSSGAEEAGNNLSDIIVDDLKNSNQKSKQINNRPKEKSFAK